MLVPIKSFELYLYIVHIYICTIYQNITKPISTTLSYWFKHWLNYIHMTRIDFNRYGLKINRLKACCIPTCLQHLLHQQQQPIKYFTDSVFRGKKLRVINLESLSKMSCSNVLCIAPPPTFKSLRKCFFQFFRWILNRFREQKFFLALSLKIVAHHYRRKTDVVTGSVTRKNRQMYIKVAKNYFTQ